MCLEKIAEMTDDDIATLDESFVGYLNNGKEIELIPGGKQKKLSFTNRWEYIELTKNIHILSLEEPYAIIKRGFNSIIPQTFVDCVTAKELENLICGMNYVYFIYDRSILTF